MSLISSLNMSFASLRLTESQLDVASSNITNADKTGYTRKTYESDYTTTGSSTTPSGGTVVTDSYDMYLYDSMLTDLTDASYYDTISTYLNNYADRLGQIDGDSTLSSSVDDLMTALETLALTPEDESLKAQVVQAAEMLAYEMNTLSSSVQDLRQQANDDIATMVESINQSLETLEDLNKQIARAEATGQSTADLEDERRAELKTLSGYIEIDYFINSDNQLKVYSGGNALLNGDAATLSYTSSQTMNGEISYPANISGIMLNGTDITDDINGGELGALITLRDETLPAEQEKLDALATALMDAMNTAMNTGSSLPARSTIIGDTTDLSVSDSLSATGSFYIATVDSDGTVSQSATIDLSTASTWQDVIDQVNSAIGGSVTASIDSNGQFNLVANTTGEGIVLNQMDSAINPDGQSAGLYLGLNNFFTGTSAEDISVSDYLSDSSEYLATSTADTAATGSAAVYAGDGSLASELADLFTTNVSFDAAGDFAAQSDSLSDYAIKIMSSVATDADNASEQADSALTLYQQTSESLQNLAGVNIDEEMARIVELEAQYEAAATLMATVQDMFDSLLAAVR